MNGSEDTFPVGVFNDMTKSYMIKLINNELQNNDSIEKVQTFDRRCTNCQKSICGVLY